MAMNPFDEIAVEEAIALREKKIISEVVALTIGDKRYDQVLTYSFPLFLLC
jgi:electron transfer flavoprotein beta subunit